MSSDLKLLRADLEELGATSIQRQHFETDVPKATAAINKALDANAKNPIGYALSIFNAVGFTPKKAHSDTNRSVIVNCTHCNGDRMVVFSTRNAPKGIVEEMAPCPYCNENANTARVGYASPSPDRVRERMSRNGSG